MNIREYRSSFTVYIIDSDQSRAENVQAPLTEAGYDCHSYQGFSEAFDHAVESPPHFIVLHTEDQRVDSKKAMQKFLSLLPESHIFALTTEENFKSALNLYDIGMYDCLVYPFIDQSILVHAVDRAAQTDYYMYMNEQLNERLSQIEQASRVTNAELGQWEEGSRHDYDFGELSESADTQEPPEEKNEQQEVVRDHVREAQESFQALSEWLDLLYELKTTELICRHFINLVYEQRKVTGVFFRYYESRRSLVATQSAGLDKGQAEGIGINLNQMEKGFRVHDLLEPEKVQSIREMVEEVFDKEDFYAIPLQVLNETVGLFIFFPEHKKDITHPIVNVAFSALKESIKKLELENRLHALGGPEEVRGVLSRHNFLAKVSEEISRARRTQLPASLVLVSVDSYKELNEKYGKEEADLVTRMLAKVFRKNSRVNDIIGRIGSGEFGLVLPHTHRQGAAIKAERLRRIVASADFSKVLGEAPRLTVSLGVSEYPAVCRDADELMQTADEALYQVKQKGSNKVCLATPAEGFKPDFEVQLTLERG